MNVKIFNSLVICFIVVMMMCTLVISVQKDDYMDSNKDKKATLAPAPAHTPINLTGDNERQDIVKWARAQKDYREQSTRPITIFHSYYGKTNEPWCQMFLNWCSEKAKIPASQFYRGSFACLASYNEYKNFAGVNRTTTSANGIKAGWLVYERFGGGNNTPNHVGMYTGNSWIHGNYNDYYVREIKKNWGNLVGYAKPYYRSKVYFNTNKQGASMKGYVYPKEYSAWYVEEKNTSLSTKGLSCPGFKFEGWYTESSCTNKKVTVGVGDFGAIRVYAKWKATDEVTNDSNIVVDISESENTINDSVESKNINTNNNVVDNTKPNNTAYNRVTEKKTKVTGLEKAKRIASNVINKIKNELP